jgi:rod shape-determining protein MreC
VALRRSDKPLFSTTTLRAVRVRATPAVLALVAVTLIIASRLQILPLEPLRMAVADVMAPILSAVSRPFAAAVDSVDGVQSIRALKAENIRLQAENERLRAWYETALKLEAENKSLHDLLNVKADPSLDVVTTRIVSDPGGSFVKSVLVPAGSADKVAKGSAVMAGKGLIGRIMEVGRNAARVLLVTDLNSRIPVTIQATRTRAILAGRNGDLLKLERLPPDSGLTVGQRVVTSGDDGILPPEIPIGTIVSVGRDGVFVKPLSDISAVTHVQIINVAADPVLSTGVLQ